MQSAIDYSLNQNRKISFMWFLPIYIVLITLAYILSSSIFPETANTQFWELSFSQKCSFNQTLFNFLSIGVIFICLIQILSNSLSIGISMGNYILALILVINVFCFFIGINTPLFHTTKLWIIKEHLSLLQVLLNLKQQGEMHLYYIMLAFTFIIPIFKMIAMLYEIFLSKANRKKNSFLSLISKWAMLDVMIVGVIVSTMKSGSGYAEIKTGSGLIYFITSVLLSLLISSFLPFTKNN